MVKILREVDATLVIEVTRKHGISDQTIYLWRKRFGKVETTDVKRLRHLEQENAKLKKLVAERERESELESRQRMSPAAGRAPFGRATGNPLFALDVR